jgi:GAF domain-containing protein
VSVATLEAGAIIETLERPVFEAALGNRSDDIVSISVGAYTGERTHGEEMHRLLTETTRLLGTNLDSREALSRIADLTLSILADWCVIETVDAQGRFTQVSVAHRDPAKAELVREMRRRYPPQPDRPNVPLRVLKTGLAELLPEVSDALLAGVAQNADHLSMLQELRPTSLIVVPLRTRERILGTILLGNVESGRQFGLADLELAEDLGKRVALAIDNAMLLESER